MIHVEPRSFRSHQFIAEATDSGKRGEVNYAFWGEQGSVVWDGVTWEVRKHGIASGYWTLNRGDDYFADAQKASAFRRDLRVETGEHKLELRRRSSVSRSFDIYRHGAFAGSIEPAGFFTRRAVLDLDPELPELLQLFCFWMVGLMWRRIGHS